MSETWITGLRTFGAFLAFAALGWIANITNLDTVLSPSVATIISGLAAILLAMWDKSASPAGTILFGSIGN